MMQRWRMNCDDSLSDVVFGNVLSIKNEWIKRAKIVCPYTINDGRPFGRRVGRHFRIRWNISELICSRMSHLHGAARSKFHRQMCIFLVVSYLHTLRICFQRFRRRWFAVHSVKWPFRRRPAATIQTTRKKSQVKRPQVQTSCATTFSFWPENFWTRQDGIFLMTIIQITPTPLPDPPRPAYYSNEVGLHRAPKDELGFSDRSIRAAFVRKVFAILMLMV